MKSIVNNFIPLLLVFKLFNIGELSSFWYWFIAACLLSLLLNSKTFNKAIQDQRFKNELKRIEKDFKKNTEGARKEASKGTEKPTL